MKYITVKLTESQAWMIYNTFSDPEYVSQDPFVKRITTKLYKALAEAKS